MVNKKESFSNMENADINSLSNEELERIVNGDLSVYEQQQEQPQQRTEENDDRDFNSNMSNEELSQYLNENGVETNQPQMQNAQISPNQKEGFLKSFVQALTNASRQGDQFSGVNSPAFRNAISGAASGGYENVRGLTDLLGLGLSPREFGGNPESFAFNLGKAGGQYIPQIAGGLSAAKGIAKAAPFLGKKIIPEAIAGGALGALAHPGDAAEKLQAGAIGAAVSPVGTALFKGAQGVAKGVKNISENLKYASPGNFKKRTQSTLNDILGGKPITEDLEYELIYDQINKTIKSNKKQASNMYDKNIQEAYEKGYNGKVKPIEIGTSNFLKNPEYMEALNKNTDIKKRVIKFLGNPSFKNAHDLQSKLNNRAYALKYSKDNAKVDLSKTYDEIRKRIINSINKTFNEHGDKKLAKDYKKTTKWYKNNVVPYRSTKELRGIARSNPKEGKIEYPKRSPVNVLSEGTSEMKTVIDRLPEESKRVLLARMLESSKKGGEFDFNKLKTVINQIKSGHRVKLINKKDLMKLEDFLIKGKKLEKTREFVGKHRNKFYLGGALLGGGKVAKELLSE